MQHRHLATRPAAITGLILLVPLVMTFVDRAKAPGEGWRWSPMDFVIMGALLFGAGMAYEFLARKWPQPAQRVALAGGILVLVLAVWVELAVGGVSQLVAFLAH